MVAKLGDGKAVAKDIRDNIKKQIVQLYLLKILFP